MQFIYKEINKDILDKMCSHYGEEELIRSHMHFEDGSVSLAAMCGDIPAGFISVYTENFTPPLIGDKDACVAIIEVDRNYRRRGIGSELVGLAEEWAAKNGFSQIRAWSSKNKIEAIPMWRKLGYCMCPAKIWVEWCGEIVDGYYVVKKLGQRG